MGFLATLLRHHNSAQDDPHAAHKTEKQKQGFWQRKKAPQKAPKLSLFLAQDEGGTVHTGSLTASLFSGSRASLSTKSSSGRSRMSVSFNPLELEHMPELAEYNDEIKEVEENESNQKTLIRHPSKTLKLYSKKESNDERQTVRPLTPHPATSSWKLSRNSKKERKKLRQDNKSRKAKKPQVDMSKQQLSDAPPLRTRMEEKQPVLRKRSSSTGSLDSDDSAQDPRIKTVSLKAYRSKERYITDDDEDHAIRVAQETDEDSTEGRAIPLGLFRRKNQQNEPPIEHIVEQKLENDLSVTSDPNEESNQSLTSFSLLSSISSVSSTAKKQLDDDSLVRKSMVNDYSIPYQVSTEASSPARKGTDLFSSTPSSPTSTAVPNIENDNDGYFSDDLLQSMLDEVSKDMEELQSLFAKNKTISSLNSSTADQNDNLSNGANYANEQSSQCSTASFDLDEFAEDDFYDPVPLNKGGKFMISTIVEEDEDGSEDDPIEAALKRGRQFSLQAEIESSRSVESDLTSTSASKISLTGSLISFVPEEDPISVDPSSSKSDASTPSRILNKSISWKMGKPEVHVFHPYTDKSYNIDSALNMVRSFDPRYDKRETGSEHSKGSHKRPVSILRSNSGRELCPDSKGKENRRSSHITNQKTTQPSDVSLSGSITSSTSMFSDASESVCRMLDRLRDETERRRARIRKHRALKQ